MNKTTLKISGLSLVLSLISLLSIAYYYLRCAQTESYFYCDAFMFGAVFYIWGIPALALLLLSILLYVVSKRYNKPISNFINLTITLIAILIFLVPYLLMLASDKPTTYRSYLENQERYRLLLEQKEESECQEYKEAMDNWEEGQPMPTPRANCD